MKKQPTNAVLDTIQVKRRYPTPRARLVKVFQDRCVLEKWFAPDPDIEVRVTAFDFRVGGDFRIVYDKPDGNSWIVTGTYTTISLPDQLAFTWQWQPPDPHAGIQTQVHLKFIEDGNDTEIVLTHYKLNTDDLRDRHRTGWQETLSNLDKHLGNHPLLTGSSDA